MHCGDHLPQRGVVSVAAVSAQCPGQHAVTLCPQRDTGRRQVHYGSVTQNTSLQCGEWGTTQYNTRRYDMIQYNTISLFRFGLLTDWVVEET